MQEQERYQLSEDEHQAIFERRIKPQLFANVTPVDRPVAIIFGGQPGAGKSAAVAAAMNELASRGWAVEINGDDLRDRHPKYAQLMREDDKTAAFYTDRDSGKWVEKSIAHAKTLGVNLVIEGTMRNPEVVAQTMTDLKAAGYAIEARAMAVNPLLSQQGIIQRYEAQKSDRGVGRMTTDAAHQAGLDGMLNTLERIERDRLADRVLAYRRGAVPIYENQLVDGQWKQPAGARQAVEAERARPLSEREAAAYAAGYDKLAQAVRAPERRAAPDDIERIDRMRERAGWLHQAAAYRDLPERDATWLCPALKSAYELARTASELGNTEEMSPAARAAFERRIKEHIAADLSDGRKPTLLRAIPVAESERDR